MVDAVHLMRFTTVLITRKSGGSAKEGVEKEYFITDRKEAENESVTSGIQQRKKWGKRV
jgi:hypothetical protein